ncbi:MAG: thiamine-phosphate kinase [Propionibacteriaceae bacterium]|jgi:thiamine-monophosphate kinase|nr:thiamine-phosphate kinase [Propionibacteriaceae bacterium]
MNETLAEVGEFALIDRLTRDVVRGPEVSLGPGDDGAVISVDGALVISVDVLNEGVHFRTDWVAPADDGHRAIAGAVADIEAMGAVPTNVLVALSAPPDLETTWFDRFMAGVLEECETAHVTLVGGDLSGARALAAAVTALGMTRGRPVITRAGAQPGDAVAIKGRVGGAAAGLAVLARGFRSPRALVSAYQRPQVPYGAGAEAARHGATALIDVSDGLVADLGHIAALSSVVIDLDSGTLDIPEPLQAVAHATGKDPLDFVLAGGEDHALVGTFPFGGVPQTWTVLGRVQHLDGRDPQILVDGQEWLGARGWAHFA